MDESLLITGRVLSGLLAGLYLAFALAVMPALRSLSEEMFVATMSRINEVIVNPGFVLVFLGAPVTACALLLIDRDPLLIAAAVGAVVALLVTVFGNVPLNDRLAAGGSRREFEVPWLAWHAVRTVASTGSFVLLSATSV